MESEEAITRLRTRAKELEKELEEQTKRCDELIAIRDSNNVALEKIKKEGKK